jgi:hypothetical protein
VGRGVRGNMTREDNEKKINKIDFTILYSIACPPFSGFLPAINIFLD